MSYTILIVDDSAIMRRMAIQAITMAGLPIATIREATNGQEAFVVLRQQSVDVILLDINMPVMNGETFLQQLRQDEHLRHTSVIVVSIESSVSRIARLRALGAGFIHKPFQPQELISAVTRLLAFLALGTAGKSHV